MYKYAFCISLVVFTLRFYGFSVYLDKDLCINGRNTPKILNFEITRSYTPGLDAMGAGFLDHTLL